MSLIGKKSVQIEIKSCGDLFHELLGKKPHQVSNLAPNHVQGCDLHEGDWGSDESIIVWKYFHDGKNRVAKQIVLVDEEKKTVTFDVIEGDLKELYKTFLITLHVDKNGETNLVTWTFEIREAPRGYS